MEYDCIRITDFLKNGAETDCPLENQVKRLQFLLFYAILIVNFFQNTKGAFQLWRKIIRKWSMPLLRWMKILHSGIRML